jgi:hypothetical protein
LKIDVEEIEYELLSGARELICSHHPTILYEYNQLRAKRRWGGTAEGIRELY